MALTAEQLAEHWPLTSVTMGPVRSEWGSKVTGELSAGEGAFFYKSPGDWLSAADVIPTLELIEDPRLRAPRPLRTRTGELLADVGGRLVYVLHALSGEVPHATVGAYRQLGELLAELHGVAGITRRTLYDPQVLVGRELREVAKRLPFQREYEALLDALPALPALPMCLIHADPSLGNTLRDEAGRLTFVDWDGAGLGPRVLDVAFPLIQQLVSEDCVLQRAWAEAFYGAYAEAITLTADERAIAFDVALLRALDYVQYGDTAARWRRIQWAIAHRAELESVLR